jgi:hypothetical protein
MASSLSSFFSDFVSFHAMAAVTTQQRHTFQLGELTDDTGNLGLIPPRVVLGPDYSNQGCGSCRSGPSLCYKVSFLDLLTGRR